MKYWMYYIFAVVVCFHPHLPQKIGMLFDYFSHSDYQFWTTFSTMDVLDLILHAGLPIFLVLIGIKKQRELKHG